jgi:hypothetical protein
LAGNHGIAARELRILRDKVIAERDRFEEAWHDYFGRSG